MFYDPRAGHPLPHDPLKAIIAPRPIGWISSLDANGVANLAPYSFFNMVQSRPPMLAFTSETMKHSAANAIATGEFVFNLATRPLFDAMNKSSEAMADGVSEFDVTGLERAPCQFVRAPRVAASPASLECKVVLSMQFHDIDGKPTGGWLVVGQVIGVHIADNVLNKGRFDAVAARTIARCGYRDYAELAELFAAPRPDDAKASA
ncbi:MAG: flavin reductase family protein [Alphaproteobacteria bacterium]|nr:flavin reductase family protein [Alphaproteobacteria bacterium]